MREGIKLTCEDSFSNAQWKATKRDMYTQQITFCLRVLVKSFRVQTENYAGLQM